MSLSLIGLGSNLGDRQQMVAAAIARLARGRTHVSSPAVRRAKQRRSVGRRAKAPISMRPSCWKRRLHPKLCCRSCTASKTNWDGGAPSTGARGLSTWTCCSTTKGCCERRHWSCRTRGWRGGVSCWSRRPRSPPTMVHPTTGWTVARLLAHLRNTPPYLAISGFDCAPAKRVWQKR